MRSSDPWAKIPRPTGLEYFKTIRVGEDLNPQGVSVSWAIDYDGRRAIYFEYPREGLATKDSKMPKFKSLETRDVECGPSRRALAVTLITAEMSDVFFEICRDLVESVQASPSAAMREVVIGRLLQWADLLKGARRGLTLEQQRGLLAELVFVKRHAIPIVGDTNAIAGWEGPYGGRQDFRFGQTFIEVKSRRGGGNTTVKISSEKQLASNDGELLRIYALEENEAHGNGGINLHEAVKAVRGALLAPLAKAGFDHKLQAVGYDPKAEYDTYWTLGKEYLYDVRKGFPRIVDLDGAISHVTYTLDLGKCADYCIELQTLKHDMRCVNGR